MDQLIIDKRCSLDDFGASLAKRSIKAPKKKEIKETVPFSNQAYDFSAINGEVYWEERELQFVLELMADTPADLEHKKARLAGWLMNVIDGHIHDPHDPDHYFVGTFSSLDWADDESVEYTACTVTFMAYPYRIAKKPTTVILTVLPEGPYTGVVLIDSAHRVQPVVTPDVAVTIQKDGVEYVFQAGPSSSRSFLLQPGRNELTITNVTAAPINVQISFYEEVF